MKRSLPIVDVLLVFAILLTSSAIAYSAFFRADARKPGEPRGTSGYRVGDNLTTVLPSVRFESARKTVIVAVRSTCRYCTESMDFYKQIVQAADPLSVVFVGTESQDEIRDYLEKHGVRAVQIVTVNAQAFKLAGTPTLLVANSSGVVVSVKEGRLKSSEDERNWLVSW